MSDKAIEAIASSIAAIGIAWAMAWVFVRTMNEPIEPSESSKILQHYRDMEKLEKQK